MPRRMSFGAAVTVIAVLVLGGLGAITVGGCTKITALPRDIVVPGVYCVDTDLTVTDPAGHGIRVHTANVTIDLGGHRIQGPTDPTTTGYGISSFNHPRVTVRNGQVSGFFYGIYLSDHVDTHDALGQFYDGGQHVIEDVTVDNSTFRGIRIEGRANVVRDNTIRWIGGTSVYDNPYSFAIESIGPAATITGNSIQSVRGGGTDDVGEGVGISVSRKGDGTVIADNEIVNSSLEPGRHAWPAESRSTYGVWIGGESKVLTEGNRIVNFAYGITYKRTARGMLHDNTVLGSYAPFYLPSVPDVQVNRAVDGGGNVCDQADCWRDVEQVYLPPRD